MRMSADATITQVLARRVWDSRGRPTVEAEIVLADGATGRAIAPAGASRGRREAIELRDGGKAFGGQGVDNAVACIQEIISPALLGRPADEQEDIDATLIARDGTPQKSRLGGNAMIAVSMAVAHAAAASARVPLWRYLAAGADVQLPMPMVQLFGGGAHAGRRIDLQDFLVVPLGARSFGEAMAMVAEVYRVGGALMAELGRLRGVADEGGWWPEFSSNEEALDRMIQAIEGAGFKAGADVGIAIGAGTDVAVEAGDVVLVRSDPRDVPRIIRLSRATYRKMIQNLWWAAGYNIVAIPLAAGVAAPWGLVLSPAVAAVLMSLSTIIVAVNAQLLRREQLG